MFIALMFLNGCLSSLLCSKIVNSEHAPARIMPQPKFEILVNIQKYICDQNYTISYIKHQNA